MTKFERLVEEMIEEDMNTDSLLESLRAHGYDARLVGRRVIGSTENRFSAVPHGDDPGIFDMPVYEVVIAFYCGPILVESVRLREETYWFGGYHSGWERCDLSLWRPKPILS